MYAEEVFMGLQRTSAYNPTPAETKKQILTNFLVTAAEKLQTDFGPTGIHIGEEGADHGFGYLIEEIAKLSPRVPKNTPAGKHLAEIILGALRTGDESLIGINRRLRNPDILWVEFTGRRAEITGIGEVKASLETYQRKPSQILMQEDSLAKACAAIEEDKERGTAHDYFGKRKIVLRSPLRKTLIVPAGKAQEFTPHLPEGWNVMEIEFTHNELIFIAKTLWSKFRQDVKFSKSALAEYEEEFLPQFIQWGKLRLERIFETPLSHAEVLFFACAMHRLPLDDQDVEFAHAIVREETRALHAYPTTLITPRQFTRFERMFTEKFTQLGYNPDQIVFFLTNLRAFTTQVKKRCENDTQRVEAMSEFNILTM